MVKKSCVLFCLFFLGMVLISPCFAQQTHHRILILYDGYQPEIMPSALLSLIFKQSVVPLTGVLSEISPTVKVQERKEEALKNGCDLILTAVARQDTEKDLTIEWAIISALEEEPRLEGKTRKEVPSSTELIEIVWLFLLEPLNEVLALKSLPEPIVSKAVRLTINAYPGTQVEGLGQPILVGPEGFFQTVVSVPTTLILKGRHLHYKTEDLHVFLTEEAHVKFTQALLPQFALGIELEDLAFMGFAFVWNSIPDAFFVKLRCTLYYWGFLFFQNDSNNHLSFSPSIAQVELLNLQLGIGGYFPSWNSFLRLYGGLDVGIRLTTLHGLLSIDPLIPVQIEPYLGLEIPILSFLEFYLECGPRLYVFSDEVFMKILVPSSTHLAYVIEHNPGLAFEAFFHTKWGFRWSF